MLEVAWWRWRTHISWIIISRWQRFCVGDWRGPPQDRQLTTFTVNHQLQPTIFMRASKDLRKCPLKYKWGCTRVSCHWMQFPIAPRPREKKSINQLFYWHIKGLFRPMSQNRNLQIIILHEMRIHIWIYLVWIIVFNSWYTYGLAVNPRRLWQMLLHLKCDGANVMR